jgi:hypothetical protein
MTLAGFPVRQIAYFVADVRIAATRHAELFGSGPFFVADHIPLRRAVHRGVEGVLDHSSAYGQWGSLMVEFVQQNDPGASVFRELLPGGREGLHHVALIVDDLDAARRRFEDQGMPVALHAEMMDGFTFLMMDAVERYGHFVELYEAVPTLTGFYEMIRDAAQTFDGTDPVRSIAF